MRTARFSSSCDACWEAEPAPPYAGHVTCDACWEAKNWDYGLLPPANGVWGKVKFLHMSVNLFTWGGPLVNRLTDWQTYVKTLPCPKLHLLAVTIHNLNFKPDIDIDVADQCNLSLFFDRFNKGITFVDICERAQIIALKNVLVNISVINVDIDIGENYSAEIMGYGIMKLHEITSWVTIICIFSNIQWNMVDFQLAKCSDFSLR